MRACDRESLSLSLSLNWFLKKNTAGVPPPREREYCTWQNTRGEYFVVCPFRSITPLEVAKLALQLDASGSVQYLEFRWGLSVG